MGIDLLDIFFRIEKEFCIKVDRENFFQMVKSKFGHLTPPENARADLRVRDLVEWVSQEVEKQNEIEATNVDHRVRKIVAFALGLYESEVTFDAWMVRDLGME